MKYIFSLMAILFFIGCNSESAEIQSLYDAMDVHIFELYKNEVLKKKSKSFYPKAIEINKDNIGELRSVDNLEQRETPYNLLSLFEKLNNLFDQQINIFINEANLNENEILRLRPNRSDPSILILSKPLFMNENECFLIFYDLPVFHAAFHCTKTANEWKIERFGTNSNAE